MYEFGPSRIQKKILRLLAVPWNITIIFFVELEDNHEYLETISDQKVEKTFSISNLGERNTDEDDPKYHDESLSCVVKKLEKEMHDHKEPPDLEDTMEQVVEEMRDSYGRIRYSVKIYNNMVILRDSFDRLNKQLEQYLEFKRLEKGTLPDLCNTEYIYPLTYAVYVVYDSKQVVPNIYLQALVFLEDSLMNLERKMNTKEEDAFCSIKERLIEKQKQYSDLIVKFRQRFPSGVHQLDSDYEFVSEEADLERDKENETEAEPWVKGEAEIQWETIQELRLIVRIKNCLERARYLTLLSKNAVTPAQKIKILILVIRTYFHRNLGCIPVSAWKKCMEHVLETFDILKQNPNIVMSHHHRVLPRVSETKKAAGYKGKICIVEDITSSVIRIYFDLHARFRFIQPNTMEYMETPREETMLFVFLQNVLDYHQKKKDSVEMTKVALLLMDLMYQKPQYRYDTMRKLADQADFWEIETDEDHQEFNEHRGSPPFAVTTKAVSAHSSFPENFSEFMDQLVIMIKETGDESSKAHAVLCDIYHHAIMDEFSKAEGLLLASHLHEEVQNMDNSTKLLLYRVVAQLGLCAFRNRLIEEAYSFLCQLYENGRVEVQKLLARGFSQSQFHEDTSEQTILEFLEVVYLICAMLVEDPNTGLLDISERNSGENPNLSRIMAASRAFGEGLYHKSFKIIKSLDIWKCLENRVPVLGMLKTKMKAKTVQFNPRWKLRCGGCDYCRGIEMGSSCGGS